MKDSTLSSITLIITGEDFDPDEITNLLGLNPSHSWKKGDKRVFRSAEPHIYTYAGWKLFQDSKLDKLSLEDQLEYWIGILSTRSAQINQLTQLGHLVELVCFLVDDGFVGFSLGRETIRRLSSLSVDLAVECCFHSEAEKIGQQE